MSGIVLNGMTWDHARGYDPLAKGGALFEAANAGVSIVWERRSLREFGEAPLEQYADSYDLIIIDHPFVGFAAAHPYLVDWAHELTAEVRRRASPPTALASHGPPTSTAAVFGPCRSTRRRRSLPIGPISCARSTRSRR